MLNKVFFCCLLITSSIFAQIPAGTDAQHPTHNLKSISELCPVSLSGTLTSSPPPNQSYCITSDLYIVSPISFSSSEFKISPNVKIIVSNNGILSINNSHLYSCSGMWKGIIVYNPATNTPSNGRVFIGNNSLIEDARCAVSFPYGTAIITGTLNALGTNATIFNKNDTAIAIRDIRSCGSGVSNPYLFSIQNHYCPKYFSIKI